ncbi:porin [Duganella violaceipulchra]|uniref:Porin n=1 Tax=Duganella violaceipulchra TaxID=2849652 RepID=A0AA41H6D5_9BURK|nr:porin [Duganella violaceicalia]MBV6321180.1 porin [Duganella violaceicalia]MCP2009574.1 putative porin [Duganella violaceicalia]
MKQAAAIVLALGAATAQAQSSVAIYGIVDAAIVGDRGGSAGNLTKVTSGAGSASRIGFRGSEELGGDMSAFFTLEAGTKIDTGEIDAAGTIFNRQALVGLKTAIGSIALGRQYTPYHTTLVNIVDPFNTGYAGSSKNLFPDSGTNIRTSNTISYASPRVNGVDGEAFYSAGEQSTIRAGRQFGAAIGYATGPLTVRLAYNSKNSDVAANGATPAVNRTLGRNTLLGANYNFGWIKVNLGYGVDKGDNAAPLGNPNNPYGGVKPTASTDGRDYLLGFSAPAGPGTVLGSVMHKDDRTGFNQDANAWGIGYLHPLSKRTSLYAAYGHIHNKNGAGYTVANNTESGTGNTGYNLGMRHTF